MTKARKTSGLTGGFLCWGDAVFELDAALLWVEVRIRRCLASWFGTKNFDSNERVKHWEFWVRDSDSDWADVSSRLVLMVE
jgi:hypothetical protein